jgi:hypothetical protein
VEALLLSPRSSSLPASPWLGIDLFRCR